jgi:hypothetical protein
MTPNSSTAPTASLQQDASSQRGRLLQAAGSQFASLRSRVRRGLWIETLGVLGLMLIAFAIPTLLTDRGLRLEWGFRAALLASFVVVLARIVWRRLLQPLAVTLDDDEMALAVERQAPGVKQALISSLQFERHLQRGSSHDSVALMTAVIDDTHARLQAIPFAQAIDAARMRKFVAALLATVTFFGGWAAIDRESLAIWASRNLALSQVDWPRYTTLAFMDTGTGEVRLPQGDALTLRIAVTGPVPDQVFLSYRFRSGEQGTEPMSRTGDGEFTLTIDAVLEDVTLQADGGDALPATLQVRIVERPRIDDLQVEVTYPDYMERDPEVLPPTESDLRLPRGARLLLSGKTQKPIAEAFLLAGGDRKLPLSTGADALSFRGVFAPEASGLLVVDVIDRDLLGAATPPKLLLRVGDDKAPTIDFRLRGIGNLIASHARIPGELKIKDDFGIRSIDVVMRAVVDAPVDRKAGEEEAKPAEVPFETAAASYANPLPRSALRYESAATVDLNQWNPEPDQDGASNRIRPGMLLSLRFGAKDNFGPGEPHHGQGETLTFRVVTREKLLEELRRRQVEQRQELLRIVADEQAAMLELRELASPSEAGDKAPLVRARLKALARQQQALGRRVALVGELYQRILWEYENNRLVDPTKVRQMEALIPQPLASAAKENFPTSSRLVEAYSETSNASTKTEAVELYVEILRRLQAVLKEMEQAESLAALLEDLRVVIKMEDSVLQEVEKRKQAEEQDTFGPGKKK